MNYVFDVAIIFLLFVLFAYLHTLLASVKVKKYIKKNFDGLIAYYRLAYNIFSLISLYVIYELSPKPHLIIYDLKNPFDVVVLIPQLLSLVGLYWAGKYICIKEFLGINQIKRAINQKAHFWLVCRMKYAHL